MDEMDKGDVEVIMVKIDIISGFLGAGKTTLIKKLLQDAFKGQQVVLIENEFGEIGIDGGFLKDAGIEIKEMNSGCICCSLVGDFGTALKEVVEKYHPDRIVIEPSGVGKLSDVIHAVENLEADGEVKLNSAVTVVDVLKCKMYLKNFGEFFKNQVEAAGTIILSRTDTKKATPEKIEAAIELIRELNPDEILDKYLHDPQYADGKKSFTRYEYWHLFRMIKAPEEAEKLYRRAYRETMAYDTKGKEKPWILAANNLAIALLRRDTFDVEILKPLIDLKRKVNMVDSFNDGISITKTEVNPETIVANQLAMYIRAYNFEEASILADKLPDTERFQMIKAFANCLGGYYDYRGAATVKEGEERKKVFKLVKESSPLNNIVMCMAMETDNYNKEAQKALEELPETAMTKYMKLVIYIREKKLYEWSYDNALDFDEACKKLEEIVKLDEKYYKIAVNDGEISKEFMEYYDQGDWKLY